MYGAEFKAETRFRMTTKKRKEIIKGNILIKGIVSITFQDENNFLNAI